jgi:hypothetical protein
MKLSTGLRSKRAGLALMLTISAALFLAVATGCRDGGSSGSGPANTATATTTGNPNGVTQVNVGDVPQEPEAEKDAAVSSETSTDKTTTLPDEVPSAADPESDSEATSDTEDQEGACLTDNCTVPAAPTLALNKIVYGDTAQCTFYPPSIIRSEHKQRLTLIYRANYASAGLVQLYARNVTIAADGSMAFASDPVNLFPGECYGNPSGVTAFSIVGYADNGTSPSILQYTDAHNVNLVRIQMTCYTSAFNNTKTFNLDDLSVSTSATTSFLSSQGAVGYWRGQNVYVKANGTTLNPDGSAGPIVIPGTWTGDNAISTIYGTDQSGGLYLATKAKTTYPYTKSYKYVSSALSVSDSSSIITSSTESVFSNFQSSGSYHSLHGLYLATGGDLNLINDNAVVASVDLESGDTIFGVLNDKMLILGSKVYSGYYPFLLKKFDFSSGRETLIASPAGSSAYYYGVSMAPDGFYGTTAGSIRALLLDTGNCVLYMTGNYF